MSELKSFPTRPRDLESVLILIQENIRRRAYEIYVRRGCQPGDDLKDWLEAEAELTRRNGDLAA